MIGGIKWRKRKRGLSIAEARKASLVVHQLGLSGKAGELCSFGIINDHRTRVTLATVLPHRIYHAPTSGFPIYRQTHTSSSHLSEHRIVWYLNLISQSLDPREGERNRIKKQGVAGMAKGMNVWMEVVPSLLEFPWKPSGTPKLATIPEEDLDSEDDSFDL